MSKLRILVLTSSTGGGHDARAEAFAEWLIARETQLAIGRFVLGGEQPYTPQFGLSGK